MRNDYYSDKWTRTPRPTQGEPPRPGGVEPYGEVPPQTGQPQPSAAPAVPVPNPKRTPEAWQRRKPKVKRRGKTGVPGFLCCLALLLGLSGLAVYAQGGLPVPPLWGVIQGLWNGDYQWPREDSPWGYDGPWGYDDPWGGDWWYGTERDDWTDRLSNTSVRRAPLGDGTTLRVSDEAGATLTAQEIYEKVNPSIVGVQSMVDSGISQGTGIIMSRDGYIITNAHVIAGSRRLEVLYHDGTSVNALLVGYDGSTDLAVLKVAGKNLPVADFGDSTALRVGDPAYAIGNPLGTELQGTMTEGIISATDRTMTVGTGEVALLQTTAALNPGNSGGALVNSAGQVVGITNMKMMAYGSEVYEGLGFAIPTAVAKAVVDQIIAQGYYDNGVPLLGITVYTLEPDGEIPGGAFVQSVDPKSDAYEQGVRPGDIVVRADGQPIAGTDELLAIKNALGVGDTLALEIWREGETLTFEITLMTRHQMDTAK